MRAALGLLGLFLACGAPQPTNPIEQAYREQQRHTAQRLEQGAHLAGYKVAFTNAAAQQAFGVREPAWAALLAEMRIVDGGRAQAAAYQALIAEVEIAFVLRSPLEGAAPNAAELGRAVGAVHVALELGDNRLGPSPRAPELIADGIGARHFALGPAHDPADVELEALQCTLQADGREVARGRPSDALGDPWASLAWLAAALARHGERLDAGQVVLTGALGRPYTQARNAVGSYTAECGALGRVSVRLE